MKPMIVTILVTILLFIAIASVFSILAFTVGASEDYEYYGDFIVDDDPNYDSIVESDGADDTGRRVLCGVLLSTFGILGIIGNILSIIVFTRSSMNQAKSGDSLIFCGMYEF